MQLSPHFKLSEFTRSDKARELGIDNTPGPAELANLGITVSGLEQVRGLLGHPMPITSGGRGEALNRAVGGSETSDHRNWLAADFTSPKFGSVRQVCEAVAASGIDSDQLIYEQRRNGDGTVTRWVHLDFGPRMRRQVLSWSPSRKYVNGIVDLG